MCLPEMPWPVNAAIAFATVSTVAITAATVTARGRSPSRSGTRSSRAWALRSSDRDGRFGASVRTSPAAAARARLRALLDIRALQRRAKHGRARGRVGGIADRPYDHRAGGARLHDLQDVRLVDAADREPWLGRIRSGIANVVE